MYVIYVKVLQFDGKIATRILIRNATFQQFLGKFTLPWSVLGHFFILSKDFKPLCLIYLCKKKNLSFFTKLKLIRLCFLKRHNFCSKTFKWSNGCYIEGMKFIRFPLPMLSKIKGRVVFIFWDINLMKILYVAFETIQKESRSFLEIVTRALHVCLNV